MKVVKGSTHLEESYVSLCNSQDKLKYKNFFRETSETGRG